MKHAVFAMAATLVLSAFLGCTTTRFMSVGSATYPPYGGDVMVLDVPLEGVDYEVIGIVSVYAPWDTSYDRLLELMREEAARNGAHAVMVCRDDICLASGQGDSRFAVPAVRILPRAEAVAETLPMAPVPAQAPVQDPGEEKTLVEKGRVTLNVEFDTGKAVVKDRYYADLAKLAEVMRSHPDLKVVIEGHTDSVGDDDLNMRLSWERAESVRNCLVKIFAIDVSRLEARGYGETRPVADNGYEEGRQRNRRVEAAVEYEKTLK